MSDRMFFSLAALIAILMIALATVAPQGLGARSPGPFGAPVGAACRADADRARRMPPRPGGRSGPRK